MPLDVTALGMLQDLGCLEMLWESACHRTRGVSGIDVPRVLGCCKTQHVVRLAMLQDLLFHGFWVAAGLGVPWLLKCHRTSRLGVLWNLTCHGTQGVIGLGVLWIWGAACTSGTAAAIAPLAGWLDPTIQFSLFGQSARQEGRCQARGG